MRTTIRLEESLLAEAKKLAHETNRTLAAVIEDALRAAVARRHRPPPNRRVKLITDGRGGLRPGIDLDNSSALLDAMESGDDAD